MMEKLFPLEFLSSSSDSSDIPNFGKKFWNCPISLCLNSRISIRFPFKLEGTQPQTCGYPGFNLSCSNQSRTVLKLPYSGEFVVRNIDYITQQIQLYDPQDCLPKRLLSFNLSGSPFSATFYQNYTFLSCPTQLTRSRFTSIPCLSNSTNSVLATPSMRLVNSVSKSCKVITSLPIPVTWPIEDQEFTTDLNDDLQLTWDIPDCGDCEAQGGMCGFVSKNSHQLGCFHDSKTGRATNGLHVFRIIALSIAVPAVSCVVGIACFACFMDGRRRNRGRADQRSATAIVSPDSPQPAIVIMGLDESTIESYQKLVLGESRRIPGPNDGICPICLSEFEMKETIRCIPACKHCFHADCIDEWLRMNTTCPLCRNSPSPSHVTTSTNV
ncbi:putative Ring finger protein [Quillaja saponaria]|uniref:Ring finger protein n=1 Tax=Quillaja saponaria TaxID=32244 RepID=A0AAD7PDP2_QUISA|nr:putative Ring finger protein [Quillaja saponaria]